MTYEAKMLRKISECKNSCKVYILMRMPESAAAYAKMAAHLAFTLNPSLREAA